MVIAIDGPAGSGKSSTAKLVAKLLGIRHIDTGAMYRIITLKCLREGISFNDEIALKACVESTVIKFVGAPPNVTVLMDDENVTKEIRCDTVTKNVSDYCKSLVVRNELVNQQRKIGKLSDSVCEGRDIGTVVFPTTKLKFFMICSVTERARRRQLDFEALGIHKSIDSIIADIEIRDKKDSGRINSPLKKANDAIMIDTTGMTLEKQANFIVDKVKFYLKSQFDN